MKKKKFKARVTDSLYLNWVHDQKISSFCNILYCNVKKKKIIKIIDYLYSGDGQPCATHSRTAPSSWDTCTCAVCSTTLGEIMPRWAKIYKESHYIRHNFYSFEFTFT